MDQISLCNVERVAHSDKPTDIQTLQYLTTLQPLTFTYLQTANMFWEG